MKVLIATEKPFAKEALEAIKQEIISGGHSVDVLEKYADKAQLLSAVSDANAMIVRSDVIDKSVITAANDLKIVVRAGAGYDTIDTDYAKTKGVVVELVFGLLVYAVRNFYNGKSGSELNGKKLGILAFGNVGRNVARIAKGFGMEVYAFDEYCPAKVIGEACVHAVKSRDELFKQCDIVSLHIPATPETQKSINYDVVNLMKKGGILVNTARKEVIDEAGLLKLMGEREDLKFITDIMPDATEDFAKFEGRYFTTPKKMGAQTAEANINAGIAAARQINSFFATGDETFRVYR